MLKTKQEREKKMRKKEFHLEPAYFDEVNKNSCLKYVVVGMSPGANQTPETAVQEYKKKDGLNYKFEHAFAGTQMRRNLYNMFNHIFKELKDDRLSFLMSKYNLNKDGEPFYDSIFKYSKDSNIDFTSLIKDKATYINKKGVKKLFNTPKDIMKSEALKKAFENGFKKDYKNIYSKQQDILFIACGRAVYNFLISVVNIPETKVIAIVHPSGAGQNYVNKYLHNDYNPQKKY